MLTLFVQSWQSLLEEALTSRQSFRGDYASCKITPARRLRVLTAIECSLVGGRTDVMVPAAWGRVRVAHTCC